MIEIELRGMLNKQEYEKVLILFNKKAKFIKKEKRLSLVYFRHKANKDVREIKDDPLHLRIRITNNKNAELVLKYGTWGVEENRREIKISITPKDFDEAVDFLNLLGWNKGVVVVTHTELFDYKEVEFAVVKSGDHYYFEAEKTVKNEQEVKTAKKEIKQVCKELKLRISSEDEFIDQINSMNRNKENQFDFSKQPFSKIRERFKEYC